MAVGRNIIIGTAGAIFVQKKCCPVSGIDQIFEIRQSLATIPYARVYEELLAENGSVKKSSF